MSWRVRKIKSELIFAKIQELSSHKTFLACIEWYEILLSLHNAAVRFRWESDKMSESKSSPLQWWWVRNQIRSKVYFSSTVCTQYTEKQKQWHAKCSGPLFYPWLGIWGVTSGSNSNSLIHLELPPVFMKGAQMSDKALHNTNTQNITSFNSV